ncbi:VOC family protein [Candidatus Leptofilum sp.]|uniref:VOC family protein n=1 Tax=Candidatus Leptofilum sp. TaxID=3241576 RepID=UPI003B5B81AD
MNKLNSIDLMVSDVQAAAKFFEEIAGMELRFSNERFAELVSDDFVVMLSPDAMIPTEKATGIILHFAVEDVTNSLQMAKEKGASVLLDVTKTEWGTESAMVKGPEGVVVDFYRNLDETSVSS